MAGGRKTGTLSTSPAALRKRARRVPKPKTRTWECVTCGVLYEDSVFAGNPPKCPTCRAASRKAAQDSAHLKRTFGITRAEYDAILEFQQGCCAIFSCLAKVASRDGRRLAVDHSHRDGLVRGLLCTWHNRMIRGGMTPELLRELADYLENPPAVAAIGERRGTVGPVRRRRRKR